MTEYDGPLTKVTFLAIPQAMICLRAAAKQEDLTQTDVINRALQLYAEISAAASMGLTLTITPDDFRSVAS